MKFRTSLRYRVTLAFLLLGGVLSAGLGAALYLLTIAMEERLIAETLSVELAAYMTRYQDDPDAAPPASTTIRSYALPHNGADVPDGLAGLPAGLHQLTVDGTPYFADKIASAGTYPHDEQGKNK